MKSEKEIPSASYKEIEEQLEREAEQERIKEMERREEHEIEIEILTLEMKAKVEEGDWQGVHENACHLSNLTKGMMCEPLLPKHEIVNVNVHGPLPLKDLDPLFRKYLEHGNQGKAKKVNISALVTGSFEYWNK